MTITKKLNKNVTIGLTSMVTIALTLIFSNHAYAATYTVTNTNDSGAGSFRQAILNANASAGADIIAFSIVANCPQIIPTSPLPPINSVTAGGVTIDASTQACDIGGVDAPNVMLSGNGAGANAIGIYITGNGAGSSVRGFVINKFSGQGIFIDTSNVSIFGNYIGTSFDGTTAAGNGGDGIGIFSGTSVASANNNTIGGTISRDRNVISGNALNGIGITAQVGGNASNNVISGNYVGTNATGTAALPNGGDGILINHADAGGPAIAANNTIGGTLNTTPGGACTGACNLVSGNIANGMGLWHGGVSGSHVYGNYVGINVTGTAAIANGNIGIEVNEAPNNTIGGTTPAARNVFSGNHGAGVFLTGAAATGNVIQGNYIGTNAAGTGGIGNTKMGIGIGASPNAVGANNDLIGGTVGTTPGGDCTGACNLISGNGSNGIFVTGTESQGHIIVGNYIGTNAAGSNSIGNALDGIGILNTPNTRVGGPTINERNLMSGNGSNGVIIVGAASTGNRIQGNYIGMTMAGTALGNTASGVAISAATDTAIISNDIAFNGLLGIDLDNNGTPNLNDPGDTDGGANRLQNFPNVYAVKTVGATTKIGGQFNGAPSTGFLLEFFSSNGCNAGVPNNYGEGQTFIGSTNISTDIFGNTAFGFVPSSFVAGGKYITATATKKIGTVPAETSEFSQCILVNVGKPALTNGATWFLKNDLVTGPGDKAFGYGFPAFLLMCAWDPVQPGVKLPVVFSGGTWYMRASYTTGKADLTFVYGNNIIGVRPVCGDWNGDGVDTIGVVDLNSNWSLRNTNGSGTPDAGSFQFGPSNAKPVVGDWDGDGIDTVGLVDSSNNWYLRNTNSAGAVDISFNYGYTPGYPVVGDWDGDGRDSAGSVSTGGTWALRSPDGQSSATFQFGFPGTTPLNWH